MKDKLVRGVRQLLPAKATSSLEEIYRKGRAKVVAARYGFPARDLKVIAVTGTNGKTTTACYINEILKASGLTTALFSTAVIEVAGERRLNDLNMTVASVSQMQQFFKSAKKADADYVIIEAASHALHQHKLSGLTIECAVMTNLTQDHLDYHHTMEEYAATKARLFALQPRFMVLNADDEWFDYFNKFEAGEHKMTYGTSQEADCQIRSVKLYRRGSEAQLLIDKHTILELATSLPGKYNVYNMTAAAVASYLMYIKLDAIRDGIANLEGIPGRFEYVDIDKPYNVVVDYAHTPDGLEKLLEAGRSVAKNRVILVFGACGDRDKTKRPIMGQIAVRGADRIILTDEESYYEDPQQIRDMIREGIEEAGGNAKTDEIADRREAIAKAMSIARKGDVIFVTGMGHEQFRIVNGERLPWNDGDVVREIAGIKSSQTPEPDESSTQKEPVDEQPAPQNDN